MKVGLTGGLGSGKSTVAAMLAKQGAVIIDADAIAREVVEPHTPGYAAVVARFGSGVISPDGALDRQAIAAIVFNDAHALADLNAIVHPLVGRRSAELMAVVPPGAIVVYDVPLLAENDLAGGFDVVVVVEAPLPLRLSRLADRGLPEPQARERIAAQATDEQRRAVADEVVVNDGAPDELATAVDELWARLRDRAENAAGRGG